MPGIQSSAPGHVSNARIKSIVDEVLAEQPPGDHTHTIADVTGLASALAEKASLVEGKVPASQLPSYVDDVLEFASFAAFPATGESGKIYIDTATNEQYRWSGSAYISIVASPGSSDEVAEGATNKYYTDARAALKADAAHTHEISDVLGLSDYLPIPGVYDNVSSQVVTWANGVWQEIAATSNLAISFVGVPPIGVWLRIRVTAVGADRTVTFPIGTLFSYDVPSVVVPSGYTKTFIGMYDGEIYEFGYTEDRGIL